MSYAYVTNNAIQYEGSVPDAARRLDTQQWVLGLINASPDIQQACGFYKVTDVPRPLDTAIDTFDRTLVLTDGVPTEVWIQRPKNAGELQTEVDAAAAVVANTNESLIKSKIDAALAANDAFLAIPAPTNTQLANQLRVVTRENTALIRLVLRKLDSIAGT